eukprot:4812574-Pyramimonas_sp.AAC.1
MYTLSATDQWADGAHQQRSPPARQGRRGCPLSSGEHPVIVPMSGFTSGPPSLSGASSMQGACSMICCDAR